MSMVVFYKGVDHALTSNECLLHKIIIDAHILQKLTSKNILIFFLDTKQFCNLTLK